MKGLHWEEWEIDAEFEIKVLGKRETSRPDRGIMKRRLQVLNQRGEVANYCCGPCS